MAKEDIYRGTTGKIAHIFIQDATATNGAGLTGLTSSSTGLTASYIREGDTATSQVALVAGTVGTWSSGGFVAVDATNMPGVYEFGVPNAALSTGNSVLIMLKGATNMVPLLLEYELMALNPQDGTAAGLAALPAAAASAVGGLPTLTDADGQGTAALTGVQLASSEHLAVQGDVGTGLTTQGYTTTRASNLDHLDAAVSGVPAGAASAVFATVVDGAITFAQVNRYALARARDVYSVVQGTTPLGQAGGTGTIKYQAMDGTTCISIAVTDDSRGFPASTSTILS